MRLFQLIRDYDATGVSGEGSVAEGVLFTDGSVAMRWKTKTASTCFYACIEDVQIIHGHQGASRIVFEDEVCCEVAA